MNENKTLLGEWDTDTLAANSPAANHNYKDTLFRLIYKDKKELLPLYNAVHGTNYTNPDDLEIVTLENAIYMNMKNDLAFLVNCHLSLYEHQSTVNPNMPLRDLFYVARVRKYKETFPLEEAIERAVQECIKEDILKDFLTKYRREAVSVSIFEYDEEEEMKLIRKQEREAAMEAAMETGMAAFISLCQEIPLSKADTLAKLVSKFTISEESANAYLTKYWKNI